MADIEHQVRERPILFNGAMVRAILAGRKTQTRRAIKWNNVAPGLNLRFTGLTAQRYPKGWVLESDSRSSSEWRCQPTLCPFGQPGDRLWVRETTVNVEKHGYLGPVYLESEEGRDCLNFGLAPAPDDMTEVEPHEVTLRPSIHMPRSMCRLVLEITAVRVERLQAISEADALAEGIEEIGGRFTFNGGMHESLTPRLSFQTLWDNWASNPWVWVIEFKRVEADHG